MWFDEEEDKALSALTPADVTELQQKRDSLQRQKEDIARQLYVLRDSIDKACYATRKERLGKWLVKDALLRTKQGVFYFLVESADWSEKVFSIIRYIRIKIETHTNQENYKTIESVSIDPSWSYPDTLLEKLDNKELQVVHTEQCSLVYKFCEKLVDNLQSVEDWDVIKFEDIRFKDIFGAEGETDEI